MSSPNPGTFDVGRKLLAALGVAFARVAKGETEDLITMAVTTEGMEVVDHTVVDRHFDELHALCREFDFQLPPLLEVVAALSEVDAQLHGTATAAFASKARKQMWYRFEATKLRMAVAYIRRICMRGQGKHSKTVKIGMLKALFDEAHAPETPVQTPDALEHLPDYPIGDVPPDIFNMLPEYPPGLVDCPPLPAITIGDDGTDVLTISDDEKTETTDAAEAAAAELPKAPIPGFVAECSQLPPVDITKQLRKRPAARATSSAIKRTRTMASGARVLQLCERGHVIFQIRCGKSAELRSVLKPTHNK